MGCIKTDVKQRTKGGVKMDYNLKDLEKWNEKIEAKAKELGLDYYPQEFEIVGFNEMLGYEAYVGMPSKYPHWSYGKAYEKNKTLYSLYLTGLPYEMVINSYPCLPYLIRENTLLMPCSHFSFIHFAYPLPPPYISFSLSSTLMLPNPYFMSERK